MDEDASWPGEGKQKGLYNSLKSYSEYVLNYFILI